jgi:hypothetical protein
MKSKNEKDPGFYVKAEASHPVKAKSSSRSGARSGSISRRKKDKPSKKSKKTPRFGENDQAVVVPFMEQEDQDDQS